jgi:TP53 regulating kinase-like protein
MTDQLNNDLKLISQGIYGFCFKLIFVKNTDNDKRFAGAEAKVYSCLFLNQECIVKERFVKAYRHPQLDARISAQRTLYEARILTRCRKFGIHTPTVYHVDTIGNRIFMEHVRAPTLNAFISNICSTSTTTLMECDNTNNNNDDNDDDNNNDDENLRLLRRVAALFGDIVARLHNNQVIHGDLTTSNVLIQTTKINDENGHQSNDYKLVMIDFGLGYVSTLIEDKAVDLYVMSRAIASTHAVHETLLVDAFFTAYKASAENADQIYARYEDVSLRGRKKVAFG